MTLRERLPDFVSDPQNVDDRDFAGAAHRRVMNERGLSREERARNLRVSKWMFLGALIIGAQVGGVLLFRAWQNSTAHLVSALSSPNPSVRASAAIRLTARPADADRIVPALEPCLSDSEARVRQAALFCLLWYSRQATRFAPTFVRLLDDPDEMVRHFAGSVLISLPNRPETLEAVISIAASGHRAEPPFSGESYMVLCTIGGRHRDAYPSFVELLKDDSAQPNARQGAAYALSSMAYHAPDLAPAITALADELETVAPDLAEKARPRHAASSVGSLQVTEDLMKMILSEIDKK